MKRKLEIGSMAPDFEAETYGAEKVRLSDFYSKSAVVLYFYPRDNTYNCTKEACSFRDAETQLKEQGIQVFGISTDGVKSHEKFRNKHKLNFPLLADPDKKVAELYGVKRMFPLGARRNTFLIEKGGKIVHIWRKVDARFHGQQVLGKAATILGKS